MTNASIEVRKRLDADIPALAGVLVDVYDRDGYPVEGVADPTAWLVNEAMVKTWVATLDGAVCGHVALVAPNRDDAAVRLWLDQHPAPLEDLAVMARLFVSPNTRGHGLGSKLVDAVVKDAQAEGKTLVLDVMDKDTAALRLYESAGFVEIGKFMHEVPSGPVPARAYALAARERPVIG